MRKIPSDLDALMWQLVEDGDLAALDDFESRFPEFKGELAGRLAMVRGLKRSKPARSIEHEIPRFVARPRETVAPKRGLMTVSVLGGLAVIALASFVVVSNLPAPPTDIKKPPVSTPQMEPENSGVTDDAPKGNMDGNSGGQGGPPQAPTIPDAAVRKSIKVSGAPLYDVLEMVAQSFDMVIELAPNMPNPTIDVDFQNQTGMEILRELGRMHKFTPLEQGKGEVLLIPAVPFTDPQ